LTAQENDVSRSPLPRENSFLVAAPAAATPLAPRSTAVAAADPAVTLPLPSIAIPDQCGLSAPAHRRRRATRHWGWRYLAKGPWPLLGMLIAQALLSLRLIWSNTTFRDEALYLWTGQLELAHWLHGVPAPGYFPTYLSGAPVVYPPIAAAASSVGGLAAARGLSLCFMLGATALLHGVTRRIFDRRAALFATALFAGIGSVQFLGALATYDAMALFLLAAATWTGVRAVYARPVPRYLMLASAGVALSLSNAAKYASTLFDPVVITVVMLLIWQRRGRGHGIMAALTMTMTVTALIAGALSIAGAGYLRGIEFTTVARQTGITPIPGVLFASGKWIGIVAILAIIGAASLSVTGNLPTKALAWSLATAVFLAPAEQARIHVITSLFKHVAYGAWFGCIVAGYGIGALALAVPVSKGRTALGVGVTTVAVAAIPGVFLASFHYAGWPRATPLISAMRAELPFARGPVLLEDAYLLEYYLGDRINWTYISSNYYFVYSDPVNGRFISNPSHAYTDAIHNDYFGLIELSYSKNAADGFDKVIKSAIDKYGGYRLVADIPYRTSANTGDFLIWLRRYSGHQYAGAVP
jgi:Dolichyl-phosphate-mannose-protein mannosyltransferase